MTGIARQTTLPPNRIGTCAACGGQGTYRMGCARAICHVCKGRGFFHLRVGEVQFQRVPNQGQRGGESKIKAVLLALLLLALSCATEGIPSTADAAVDRSRDLPGEAGRVPVKGTLADAAAALDLSSPDLAAPDLAAPDLAAPDSVSDARVEQGWPICEPPPGFVCNQPFWGEVEWCKEKATFKDPSGSQIICLRAIQDGGYYGDMPCVYQGCRGDGGTGEVPRAYVRTCEECAR